MKRSTEVAIFFSSLAVIGLLVVGGILYFNNQKPETPPAPASPVVQQQAVNTIPTSTITIPAPSPASVTLAPLALPYSVTAMTSNATYWPKDWGDISFIKGGISFTPDTDPDGANSFLNGASSWSNYAVSANVSSLNGGWFDIVARVANKTQNFVYCEFGSNGTEIIERVNGSDTQIAHAAASITNTTGGTENFGMEVYGNDIACMMAGQEVVGIHVQDGNESSAGGIGFVIFSQVRQQNVQISNISVSALSNDTIVEPFPVVSVVASSSVTTSPPPPATTTPPTTPTTTISLPYSASTFDASDWYQGWGYFSTASGTLALGSTDAIPGGGIFLKGSNSWINYKFTAYVEWINGKAFELVARRTDGSNLLECIFEEADSADTTVSINMVSNGQTTVLDQGQTFLDNTAHMTAVGFEVSMAVQGSNVQCELDNQTVSSEIPNGVLTKGGIGFITWDPAQNNSQINVTKISVTPL